MIYQFKIALNDINPPIWRRALLDPTMTMEELHYVTQSLMGWESEHLYYFSSGKRRIVDPEDEEHITVSGAVGIGQAETIGGDSRACARAGGGAWSDSFGARVAAGADGGG